MTTNRQGKIVGKVARKRNIKHMSIGQHTSMSTKAGSEPSQQNNSLENYHEIAKARHLASGARNNMPEKTREGKRERDKPNLEESG